MTRVSRNTRTKGKTDWARVDALTDAEIAAAVCVDPDAVPIGLDWSKAKLVTPPRRKTMTKKLTPKRSRPAPLVDAATVSLSIQFAALNRPVTRKAAITRRAIKELIEDRLMGLSIRQAGIDITSVTVRDVDAP